MTQINRITAVIFFYLLAAIPTLCSAADETKANSKVLNPWTDCGIGAMIFTDTGWAAAISNVIWDLGTTAVTSNVSSQNSCGSSHAKVAMLIGTTYANLEEETVKGDGQNIHAMLNIMNCDPSSHENIIGSIRTEFVQSLRDASYIEKTSLMKAEEYYNIVQTKVSGEYTWARSGYWAMVTSPPGKIPVTAEENSFIAAVSALEKIGDSASVQSTYIAALNRWPGNLSAQIGVGNVAYRLHDLHQAETVFRQAAQDHPDSVAALNNLAQTLLDQARYQEALEAARRAVSLGGPLAQVAQETLADIENKMKDSAPPPSPSQ